MLTGIIYILQFILYTVIGLYFFRLLKSQQGSKKAIEKESKKELDKLNKLRKISLTEPLSEITRPTSLEEIIGQQNGLKGLKAAMCGPNPQHVIIYGPPGVGKTAAARVVLEEAKKTPISPFKKDAHFIEIDAATLRFDERGIADPLMGCVHDPIYQGAGAYGMAGVPQPKPGAVTKAHGGVLFIDEIGELHPVQINKLLKVLEDRTVFLESSYYNSEDKNIPEHIHEMFKKGLPADFRLVGATTRSADEIPPAIRSRCVEIFFRPLLAKEIVLIAKNAALKGGFEMSDKIADLVAKYAQNGRDAVNIVQTAGGIALTESRYHVLEKDVEWVIGFGHYNPRIENRIPREAESGCVNVLAVTNNYIGTLINIEVSSNRVPSKTGSLKITGIVEEEEMSGKGQRFKKTSSAKSSVENALTVLKKHFDIDSRDFDLHLNFLGGVPLDGPSAGVAIVTVLYSAIKDLPIRNDIAMTGEISIKGKVKPVGGIAAKVEAARIAGVKRVLIPKENWQEMFRDMSIEVIPVDNISQVIELTFGPGIEGSQSISLDLPTLEILTASKVV